MSTLKIAAALTVAICVLHPALAVADPEGDFRSAYATALQAEQRAAAVRNRWTSTEATLAAARKAADAKDWGKAASLAREAGALALHSVKQAQDEETAWKDAVIR